nr:hypothetical protein [Paenibacillus lautus]
MDFQKAHGIFMHDHLSNRTGERRGRLERGHGEAEILFCQNIWWPLRGHFRDLHPQFEVLDWRGRSEMDRQKYGNELNRETFLSAMGYQVISFACDKGLLIPVTGSQGKHVVKYELHPYAAQCL